MLNNFFLREEERRKEKKGRMEGGEGGRKEEKKGEGRKEQVVRNSPSMGHHTQYTIRANDIISLGLSSSVES